MECHLYSLSVNQIQQILAKFVSPLRIFEHICFQERVNFTDELEFESLNTFSICNVKRYAGRPWITTQVNNSGNGLHAEHAGFSCQRKHKTLRLRVRLLVKC